MRSEVKGVLVKALKELGYEFAKLAGQKILDTATKLQEESRSEKNEGLKIKLSDRMTTNQIN